MNTRGKGRQRRLARPCPPGQRRGGARGTRAHRRDRGRRGRGARRRDGQARLEPVEGAGAGTEVDRAVSSTGGREGSALPAPLEPLDGRERAGIVRGLRRRSRDVTSRREPCARLKLCDLLTDSGDRASLLPEARHDRGSEGHRHGQDERAQVGGEVGARRAAGDGGRDGEDALGRGAGSMRVGGGRAAALLRTPFGLSVGHWTGGRSLRDGGATPLASTARPPSLDVGFASRGPFQIATTRPRGSTSSLDSLCARARSSPACAGLVASTAANHASDREGPRHLVNEPGSRVRRTSSSTAALDCGVFVRATRLPSAREPPWRVHRPPAGAPRESRGRDNSPQGGQLSPVPRLRAGSSENHQLSASPGVGERGTWPGRTTRTRGPTERMSSSSVFEPPTTATSTPMPLLHRKRADSSTSPLCIRSASSAAKTLGVSDTGQLVSMVESMSAQLPRCTPSARTPPPSRARQPADQAASALSLARQRRDLGGVRRPRAGACAPRQRRPPRDLPRPTARSRVHQPTEPRS